MTVSVCVITRDRVIALLRCLACLAAQDSPPTEIIIVDNSTTKETEEAVKGLSASIRFIHIEAGLGCQPLLRNIAVAEARGELLLFLDDDGFAEPGWLSAMKSLFLDPDVGGAGGRIIQGWEQELTGTNPSREFYYSATKGAMGNFNSKAEAPFPVDHLQGTNMGFRTALLREIGGWDRNLCGGYASFEEMDICLALQRSGSKLFYHPKAVVKHGVNPRAGGIGREIGTSVDYALSYSRNLAYITVKHCSLDLQNILSLLFIAPCLNTLRCFLTVKDGKRKIRLNLTRIIAALFVWVGTWRGIAGYLCARSEQAVKKWPRYKPNTSKT